MVTLILYLYVLFTWSNGITLIGSNTVSSQSISITVTIHTDTVDIVLIGPSDRWFGVGFGSSFMTNTYGIVASRTDSVSEYKLSKSGGGTTLTDMLVVNSDTIRFDTRTITMQRARTGSTNDHYTFPNIPEIIDIIWAFSSGASTSFSNHGPQQSGARGCM